MSSRQEQKAQLRAEREAEERREAARQRRQRRLWQLGAVMVVAVVVVVGAIVIAGGSGSSSTNGLRSGARGTKLGRAIQTELQGIPQSGSRLGAAAAPVTLTYYGDLECPVCREFTLATLGQIIDNDVRDSKVKIDYRSLQTATRDESTFVAQQSAALAAGKQQRLWQFIELFYRQQGAEGTGYADADFLKGIARQVPGLDQAAWGKARSQADLATQIKNDERMAATAGASATPTLIFTGPGRTQTLSGVPSYSDVEQAIAAAGGT